MLVCLDKDVNSLKNAIFDVFVYLIASAFCAVIAILFLLPLDTWYRIVIFILMMVGVAGFGLFFGYSIWYLVTYLCTKNKVFYVSTKADELGVKVQHGNKVVADIKREDIDFCSAKKMWDPLKGIFPNKIILKLKDGRQFVTYFVDDPAKAKGLINSVIKGTVVKEK